MCGIIGYTGWREVVPVLIRGLHRLEYRGYDSAGIALVDESGVLRVFKRKGKVQDLKKLVEGQALHGHVGIGHTRWATHGAPSDRNAHPHISRSGRFALVHNGIIENHEALRRVLAERWGYTFESDTDTEVVVQLIDALVHYEGFSTEEAFIAALQEIVGAYAFVLLDRESPTRLWAARKSSPLVLGIGENEFILASDATPLLEYTRKVVYLEDDELLVVDREKGVRLRSLRDGRSRRPQVQFLEWELEQIEKGGFPHFMLKEIYEQPEALQNAMRGRLLVEEGRIRLGGIQDYLVRLIEAPRFILLGCGTSWHAGLVGEYLLEDLARIPVEVDYASEFRYRNPVLRPEDVVIAISQSGETADTLAAVRLAREAGSLVLGICNVVGSSIARETEAGIYTHAGPEIGVASTKAFVNQLAVLTLLALWLAREKQTIDEARYRRLLSGLARLPDQIRKVLKQDEQIQAIAREFVNVSHFLYLGRGYNFPIALEGALKLKEISYIHAEGYPAAEMKHGPIALIDQEMPVLIIATNASAYDKIVSNAQEVRSRGGRIIAVVPPDDREMRKLAEFVIEVPAVEEPLSPIVTVVPLQLLAYHIAVLRGCNVDQPRNLAKSVTVE